MQDDRYGRQRVSRFDRPFPIADDISVATATLQVWPVAEGLEFKIGGREVGDTYENS
jgi:hypothetical protein